MIQYSRKKNQLIKKMNNQETITEADDETRGIQSQFAKSTKIDNKVDIDEIIEEIGGFSKYQFMHMSIVVMGMIAGAFILYSLYYFEIDPEYQCQFKNSTIADEWHLCKKHDIC